MTKVQKDNQINSKNLKGTTQVLEACKKEYQKLYLEHETLKRKFTQQQEELLKCQNHIKNRITTNTKKQDKKNLLNDIEFCENKFKRLLNARKRKRRYFDYYSDDDDGSADDKRSESVDESSNEEVVKKKKILKIELKLKLHHRQ